MPGQGVRGVVALAALAASLFLIDGALIGGARAFDDSLYPNLKGQWIRARPPAGVTGQGPFDPDKSWGRAQQAPLTPEYQKIFEASLADQAEGGPGLWGGARCLPVGMPAMMTLFRPMEIIILPETTYIRIDHVRDSKRRIFTDGRDWPAEEDPTFRGYSIGRWIDTDGDGRYDLLEVESRGFKSPRTFEGSGLPLHQDGESVITERIYLDKADKNLLHDEVTVIDHALTRPWTVMRHYQRNPGGEWDFVDCAENNPHVVIGGETYMMSADGFLMPTKTGQKPPDLRYFGEVKK
jgi:hypothetical protein